MSAPVKRRQNDGNANTSNTKSSRKSLEQKRVAASEMGDDESDGFEDDDVLSEDDFEEEIIDGTAEDDEENDKDAEASAAQQKPRVWRPGVDTLQEDEILDYDPASYQVYETATMEWPSLSFDILRDPNLSASSIKYPANIFAVCGTQADKSGQNAVNVLYLENIHESKEQTEDNDDGAIIIDEGISDDESAPTTTTTTTTKTHMNDPIITSESFLHPGGTINRLRAMPQKQSIISTWGENGTVYIWDISQQLSYLSRTLLTPPTKNLTPLYSFQHGIEGYAMAWSGLQNRLATGDCYGNIHLHSITPHGDSTQIQTTTATKPFITAHPGIQPQNVSIEDIAWSPTESRVFASVDTAGYLSIWHDGARANTPRLTVKASDTDVNVLSWNPHASTSSLILTGDDAGVIKVWDLRYLKDPTHAVQAEYSWHKKAITSVQWHPQESSMFIASGEDHGISIWDLALEADIDEVAKEATGAEMVDYNVPGQLLFMHLGQKEVKEVQWHPQYTSLVMSTAANGIDIFKPANLDVVLPTIDNEPTERIQVD